MSADASAPSTSADTSEYDAWLVIESGVADRLVRVLTTWWWDHIYRLRAHGVERLPADGAYLLVPNHSSYADPFLNARPQQRHLRFMAKSSLFGMPIIRRIVRSAGGFPVRRGEADDFAMELARRLLRAGRPVVVYPEGTRYRHSVELGPPKRGFARLALEVGVPVVPVATWGAKSRSVYGRRRWQRPRVTVVYGEPIVFEGLEPTRENVDRVRDVVWTQVEYLYDQARTLDAQR